MKKSILIIDDDQMLIEALVILLEEEGYSVNVAFNGKNLEEIFQEAQPQVVILDYRLPGENGLTLTRKLKNQHTIPIIMVSADHTVQKEALEVGADYFLAKPFAIDRLLNLVHRYAN